MGRTFGTPKSSMVGDGVHLNTSSTHWKGFSPDPPSTTFSTSQLLAQSTQSIPYHVRKRIQGESYQLSLGQ